jgi:phage terminase large subunit
VVDARLPTPQAFLPLWTPARWKVFWGGRGAAKSWQVARTLIVRSQSEKIKVLCTREFQTSIADSVHSVLKRQIELLNCGHAFNVRDHAITSTYGSEFMFAGLHHNSDQIKSKEGINVCWNEEAQSTSDDSWKYLIPTIREPGSEIIVTFNQHDEQDPTYQRLVVKPPPDSWVVPVTWEDNPYFPKELDDERRYHLETDPDSYDWVWGLACRKIGSAVVMRGHYVVEGFEEPTFGIRPRYGMDFGFANDPNALVRFYITTERDGDHLWITHEAFGLGVELDDLPAFMEGGRSQDGERAWEGVPGIRRWPIKADAARPETISYLRRKGFNIDAAEKWSGSVEDGVAHLKRYRQIHIHQRCKNVAREARLFSYKVDRKTGDVLPEIGDLNNHGWDAIRYGHDGEIQHAGGLGVWAKLARPGRG